MDATNRIGVVTTIENKCKRCYSCVRNCPAKAIRVEQGQARVMSERCIACGNCVRVCAQGAKSVEDGIETTRALLKGDAPVCLIVAPSFPVAFAGAAPGRFVAAAKKLGFDEVLEVAFGAELVSRAYRDLLETKSNERIITTPCPSLVKYIEKYHPKLIPNLAPIVSPMVAMARVVKQRYRPGAKVVFVGPCVSKKQERADPAVEGDVDAVLTFPEMSVMLEEAGIVIGELEPMEFEGPAPHVGRMFPVSGGLLRTAALESDIMNDDIVATEGRIRVVELVDALEKDRVHARFFDLLFCVGCISGPVMPQDMSAIEGKELIAAYSRGNGRGASDEEFRKSLEEYGDIDMSRTFTDEHTEMPTPTEEKIREILAKIKKFRLEDELNCGACGYRSCREKAIAVYQGLAENEMCLPFIIDQLMEYNERIKDAQTQLFRAEKLASLGRLAAGIAHEINNPLGGILLFADILKNKIADEDKKQKLQTIIDETIRCREIVKGVLDFSRQTEPTFGPVDVVALLDRVFQLVEQQLLFRELDIKKTYCEKTAPEIVGDAAQLQQVFLNIIVNAAQAIAGHGEISVDVSDNGEFLDVVVDDTGCGIPAEDIDKIFDPFYTTKDHKKGTGLGLSTSHGIVENHKGKIIVDSRVGVGTKFTVRLPIRAKEE